MIKIFLSIVCFMVGCVLLSVAYVTQSQFGVNAALFLGIVLILGSVIYVFIKVMRKIVN